MHRKGNVINEYGKMEIKYCTLRINVPWWVI